MGERWLRDRDGFERLEHSSATADAIRSGYADMMLQTSLAVFVLGRIVVGQAAAQDVSAGGALYEDVCRNCHGPTGKGMASFPKLVGNSPEYIVDRLMAYRAGEKVGPNTALMMPVAAELSDQDIADVAAYITSELD